MSETIERAYPHAPTADDAPLDTAAASAACNAVSGSAASPTGAPAYVRPSRSRTAAPWKCSGSWILAACGREERLLTHRTPG